MGGLYCTFRAHAEPEAEVTAVTSNDRPILLLTGTVDLGDFRAGQHGCWQRRAFARHQGMAISVVTKTNCAWKSNRSAAFASPIW